MDKKVKIVIGILILLLLILPLCRYTVLYYQAENNYLTYKIRITIEPSFSSNYTVGLPTLIYTDRAPENYDVSDIYSTQLDRYDIDYSIENSSYGQIINISAIGEFSVEFSFIEKDSLEFIYSTREIKKMPAPPWYEGSYWIFFSTNGSAGQIDLEYSCVFNDRYGYVSGSKEIKGNVSDTGWQLIEGYEEYSIV